MCIRDSYRTGQREVNFVYPSPPNCKSSECWSTRNGGLIVPLVNLASTGPMNFASGDVHEIILGATTTYGSTLPCPSLDLMWKDNDQVQAAFDNCLEFQTIPDPPLIHWEEGNQTLKGFLHNDRFSNNCEESFSTIDLIAPTNLSESKADYKFEGYKVFQIKNEFIGWHELSDPNKARLVYHCLLYTSPSPRDATLSRMPSSA